MESKAAVSGPTGRRLWVWLVAAGVVAAVTYYVACLGDGEELTPLSFEIRCPEHKLAIPVRTEGSRQAPSVRSIESTAVTTTVAPMLPGGRFTSQVVIPPGEPFQLVENIPLAADIDEIPEYHDCQRFIVDEEFAALVSIWVSQTIATTFDTTEPGLPAGSPRTGLAAPDSARYRVTVPAAGVWAHAVAVVHSTAPGYGPLGVVQDFNCLYLWRAQSDASKWGAWMVPIAADVQLCRDSLEIKPGHPGKQLEVRPASLDGLSHGDVPPVARFDREPGPAGRYLIVIKCGGTWCQVGPMGAFSQPAPGWPADAMRRANVAKAVLTRNGISTTPSSDWKRVTTVKGWDDEQVLAIWDSVTQRLRPSKVVGTITPDPDLDAIAKQGDTTSFDGQWVDAASVHVSADYHGRRFPLLQGVTLLSVCRGEWNACAGVPETLACNASPDGHRWWMKLHHPGDSVTFRCANMETHGGATGVIAAGAARWRWLEDDETTWVRCEKGCCTPS